MKPDPKLFTITIDVCGPRGIFNAWARKELCRIVTDARVGSFLERKIAQNSPIGPGTLTFKVTVA